MPTNASSYFRSGASAAERHTLLHQLLDAHSYVIHHTVSRLRFEQWPTAELDSQGQAFNARLEVRWTPGANDTCDLLVISDTPQPGLTAPTWSQQALEQDKLQTYFLWGNHWSSLVGAPKAQAAGLDGWVQAGIQSELHYPLPADANNGAVRVRAQQYRRHGIPCLTRFVDIVSAPAPEPKEANHGQ